jgi:hypothetical protein
MTKIKKLEGVEFCYNQTNFALHYELVHLHLRPQVQPSHHESTSGKAQFPRPTTLSQNLTAANGSLQAQVSPRPRLLLFYAHVCWVLLEPPLRAPVLPGDHLPLLP